MSNEKNEMNNNNDNNENIEQQTQNKSWRKKLLGVINKIKNVGLKPDLSATNYKFLLLIFILSIFVLFICLYIENNKLSIKSITIDNLLFNSKDRKICVYNDWKNVNNNGLFFIGKFSEFYSFQKKMSVHISSLDNLLPMFLSKQDDNLVILNKKTSTCLELLKYNITNKYIINKTEFNIPTDAFIGKIYTSDYGSLYIPIFSKKDRNYTIVFDEKNEKFTTIPYNCSIINCTYIFPYGPSSLFCVGGINKKTNKPSNIIYRTFDIFETVEEFSKVSFDEKSIIFPVYYYDEPESNDSSYCKQEIWIVNNNKLIKIDMFSGKTKISKLPKQFINAKLIDIINFGENKIGFIKQEDKIYYFTISYNKKIKVKFLKNEQQKNMNFMIFTNHAHHNEIYIVYFK